MSDESKLGLVAGLLAVVGVAIFNFPKEPPKEAAKTLAVAGTPTTPPNLPPAAVLPAKE
ncbi:hypothetical protein [Limnoglobus roseus]|nr:hypothetical protein [Limnoglobus roseus]